MATRKKTTTETPPAAPYRSIQDRLLAISDQAAMAARNCNPGEDGPAYLAVAVDALKYAMDARIKGY